MSDITVTSADGSSNLPVAKIGKGEIFRVLNARLPINEYDLPDHIYRADVIPSNLHTLNVRDRTSTLQAAAVPLTYEHGYPAYDESLPFWERFPYEPIDAFKAFTYFLELPKASNAENPVRILPSIAIALNIALETLVEWTHSYYWHFRARAYDLFIAACHQKQREQRLMTIEGHHFAQAEGWLNKVGKLMEAKLDDLVSKMGTEDEDLDEVSLLNLTKTADTLMKIQRISVGLPATGPLTNSMTGNVAPAPRNAPTDRVVQHIAAEKGGSGRSSEDYDEEMENILSNPEQLEVLQEIITTVQYSKNVRDKH